MIEKLILATSNQGKVAELAQLLDGRCEVESRPAGLAETVEDGDTLEANAYKKALEVAEHAGAVALADDTGLFVDFLGGRPGVRSARFAGVDADDEANVDKLLAEMGSASQRTARFRTVMALVWPGGRHLFVEGSVEGEIGIERRGDSGFGYDPVFHPAQGDGRAFGQMNKAEKNSISHRGRATKKLLAELESLGDG